MSRILRFFAFVFGVFCVGNVLAAGYSCPTYKQYTSCVKGYYMTSNASSTTYNGTPAVGNACRPCSVMGQYNNIDKYTCPGGTAAPVKKTVKVTYVLNGGSGTTPAATTCNFGEACSLNPGTGTSYRRAGYRLVGWSTASSTTSGAFSMVLTANTTVYAVWTRCAEGTYKTASATPASACATMSYGYHGTGCDSSYMACTGQAQCTGTTFCEQHIKQECPDPNNKENRREIFPEEYSGSQMVGGKVVSANGRGAITECMALVWYEPDPNVTDGQTVGLHEYVFVEGDTKRYQGEVSSWLYDAVGPGYYLTDESGCDEGYASYKSVDICPVGAACPGKEKVECDSSNGATVLTETFGLEICTDGNTTSSTGSIKCDSACSNVIGAATWTKPTWSPSTRQVLDKCAINTCSTGYTRSGSASSTAPASYTCSANCNKVTLNGIKNGGSGTTTLYKKTGLATWYSDNACSDVVTKLSPLPTKPNASYAGHYNTSAASGGTQCVAANGTFKTAAACNVSGNTTFYAQYKCDSNYLGSGTRIAGACTGTVRTIYLKSYDGSATHSTIYQKYATGWYSNSAATNEISKADIPSRDGYTFRGFYTSKQTDLTASGGTGTRRITANGTLPANTTFTSNTNLFAAWTHNCIQPSNGTCTLTISDTGTVTYTTKCNAGYYISGAGTYNPTCTPCGDGTYSAGGTATSCTTCPGEYTHSDGTRAASGNCYLTTVAGKYVATANANQITCDNTTAYYYPGGTKVYYGGTGGNVPLIKGEWNAVNTGGTCASKAYCPAGTWGSVAGTCDSIPAGSYPGVASGCATKDDAGDYIGCSGYEACSSLSGVSVSGGTYTSAAGSKNSKACKYTAPSKTITGCSTVTTNTVTYTGTAWPATTYGVTATGGYIISGNNTAAATCTQCSGAVWSAGGTATSCSACPAQTSGWTRNSGTGWTAVTQCNQTKTGAAISSYCASGVLKQNATSATAWGATTIATALSAKAGSIVNGQTCEQCSGAVWSAGGTATSCSACPAQTSGWTRNSGTGWTAVTQCNQTKTGTAISNYCASGVLKQNATSTTAWGATTISTALSAKAGSIVNGQTCTQCSGAVWSAGGTATSCSACPAQTSGWTRNSGTGWTAVTQCNQTKTGAAISSYCASGVLKQNATSATAWGASTIATALSAKAGSIVNGQTCTQCSGAVWSAGGTATSCSACPAQTSGWTRNSGTGWTAVTQCNQTKSVGGNCSAGVLKQNATSTTVWGATTISTALQAKPGYIVSGQTCTGCAAGTYSAGGTATSCSACTGRTHYSAAHASSCSTVSTGYYTTGCNTSNNNCTGQSQCTSGTWCSSGVQHQCSSLTGVSVSGGTYTSAAGSSANTSCKYTAPSKTITGCSTVTTNTVTYTGTAWPATTYGVTATGGYVISGNNTAAATCTQCGTAKYSAGGTATSCSACPTADSGWTATSPAGSSAYTACYEYQTPVNCASGTVKRAASSATAYSSTISLLSTLKSKAGYYASTTATSCTICPAGSSCAASATAPTTCVNWTYAASAGMASCKACPVLTSGWTKANSTGTGWSSHTNCVQISPTPTGCASGNNKQVAASNGATTWGPVTVNTELSAKAGHIVSGTTCPICTGATYSAGGTATSCTTCPSIYTSDNTNGKTKNSECKVTTNAGKYIATAGDNTQTICPVKHYCPSASVAYGATNSPTACPPADSTTERTTYPADYLNPTRKTFALQGWGNGLGAITSCMATYSFTNTAGWFIVENVHYNSTTGKYENGGSKYYRTVTPGWYMVDKFSSTYCDTPTHDMLYRNVAECPANSYCPGYSSLPLCSTGTYEDEMGKFACSSLGTGAYTKSPAKSGPATACYLTTTATNFVKTAKAAEEKCTAGGYCAGGTKVNWGSTGGRTPASAGYYVSGTGATSQTACAAGTYTDTTGKTTCTSAVAGTHTTGCQVAASGSSTKTLACTGTAVCATNTYSSAKASACTACATAKGYTNSGTTAAAHAELASCKATCSGGQYVATAGAGCVNVGTGYYGAGGTVGQNATLARNQCPTGQTTIGYGAGADEIGDCGRILHIGDNKVYLRNTKKTTPSLNVKVGDTTYYGNMTSGTSKGKLRVKNGTTTYSVHDDSM